MGEFIFLKKMLNDRINVLGASSPPFPRGAGLWGDSQEKDRAPDGPQHTGPVPWSLSLCPVNLASSSGLVSFGGSQIHQTLCGRSL